jgi:hypothetical protein
MFSVRKPLRISLALAVCGALMLAMPSITAGLFADGDDDIPGVATISPAEGTFPEMEDVHDVFSVRLREGEVFRAVLNGSEASDIDLGLLSPDATSLDGGLALASADRPAGDYPVRLTHPVTETGTYYLDVFNHAETWTEQTDYTVFWSTDWAGDDGTTPGAAMPDSPFTGLLETDIDQDDVYNVYLAAGEEIDVQLDSTVDADFELYLFAPGTTSIDDAKDAVAHSDAPGKSEHITYLAPVSGYYYVNAYTRDGSGCYKVTWSKKAAVTSPVVASSMSLGRTYQASGSISLRKPAPKTVARVQGFRFESSKWVLRTTQAASVATSSGRTKYTAKVRLPLRGKWRIRAYHRDAGHSASYSSYRYVTVK